MEIDCPVCKKVTQASGQADRIKCEECYHTFILQVDGDTFMICPRFRVIEDTRDTYSEWRAELDRVCPDVFVDIQDGRLVLAWHDFKIPTNLKLEGYTNGCVEGKLRITFC